MIVLSEPTSWIPVEVVPEITLPAAGSLPPIVVSGEFWIWMPCPFEVTVAVALIPM